ncbi:MAG TPA: hypothetical protein VHO24_09870 [Opitutaceae bacterium]|nr:hypothetical protein [Opitutaceae bacterium]
MSLNVLSFVFRLLAFAAVAGIAFFAGRATVKTAVPPGAIVRLPATHSPTPTAGQVAAAVPLSAGSAAPANSAEFAAAAAMPVKSFAAEDERQRLIEKWAASDPRAAIDFVRTKLKGDRQAQALAATLAIWGEKKPAEAWNWVMTEMPAATHHFDTLLEVFGRNSTDTAARYAAEFAAAHPEAALEVHLAALLGVTHRGDFAGACALVGGNATLDPEVRANLNNFIAGQWARFAPKEAAVWVMSLPAGLARDQALIGLGESWSDIDPARAATFAVTLPSGPTRTLAMRQAVSKWVMTDPEAARAWVIATERHDDFDQAITAIATDANLVSREPSRALKWASTIFDDSLRAESISTILHNWYPANPAAATTYIQSCADLTPEQRTDLLQRLESRN